MDCKKELMMQRAVKNMERFNALPKEQQEQYLKKHPVMAKRLRVWNEWSELMKDWEHEVKEVWE